MIVDLGFFYYIRVRGMKIVTVKYRNMKQLETANGAEALNSATKTNCGNNLVGEEFILTPLITYNYAFMSVTLSHLCDKKTNTAVLTDGRIIEKEDGIQLTGGLCINNAPYNVDDIDLELVQRAYNVYRDVCCTYYFVTFNYNNLEDEMIMIVNDAKC